MTQVRVSRIKSCIAKRDEASQCCNNFVFPHNSTRGTFSTCVFLNEDPMFMLFLFFCSVCCHPHSHSHWPLRNDSSSLLLLLRQYLSLSWPEGPEIWRSSQQQVTAKVTVFYFALREECRNLDTHTHTHNNRTHRKREEKQRQKKNGKT